MKGNATAAENHSKILSAAQQYVRTRVFVAGSFTKSTMNFDKHIHDTAYVYSEIGRASSLKFQNVQEATACHI